MNVLIIPSWYPDKLNPIKGIYFKEQIAALNELDELNISILYVKYFALSKVADYLKSKNDKSNSLEQIKYVNKYYLNIFPKFNFLKKKLITWNTIKYYNELVKLSGKPDVIHAHVTYPAGYQALILKREYNIPIVITEHATFFKKEFLNQYRGITNEVLKDADHYVAVSSFLRDEIIQAGRKQCDVIPNYIDFNKFEKHYTHKPTTKKTFTFINVNDFQYKKGIDLLLKSIHQTVNDRKISSIHFYIIGEGKDKKKYQIMSRDLNIEQYCTFLGRLSNEEVAKYMNRSDACIISSRKETFAVVGIEALASGIPVLSTECYGPEDYINENNGILVENDNVDSLTDGIVELIKNYERFNGKKINKNAKSKYSKEAVTQKYVKLYKEVRGFARKN